MTSIGGALTIALAPELERLSFPQLTTIQGDFMLNSVGVSQLDVGRVQTIGGRLSLSGLCNLPWSQASRLASLVTNQTVGMIGCCTGQTTQHECGPAGSSSCSCN